MWPVPGLHTTLWLLWLLLSWQGCMSVRWQVWMRYPHVSLTCRCWISFSSTAGCSQRPCLPEQVAAGFGLQWQSAAGPTSSALPYKAGCSQHSVPLLARSCSSTAGHQSQLVAPVPSSAAAPIFGAQVFLSGTSAVPCSLQCAVVGRIHARGLHLASSTSCHKLTESSPTTQLPMTPFRIRCAQLGLSQLPKAPAAGNRPV